jgi:hypothetical protein
MKVVRFTLLVLVLTGSWAATAMGMPASDPDMLVTKRPKAVQAPGSGFDWTYVGVGVGVVAALVLVVGAILSVRHRHAGTPVRA